MAALVASKVFYHLEECPKEVHVYILSLGLDFLVLQHLFNEEFPSLDLLVDPVFFFFLWPGTMMPCAWPWVQDEKKGPRKVQGPA